MADYAYTYDTGLYFTADLGGDTGPDPINNSPRADGRGGMFSLSALNNSFVLLSGGVITVDGVDREVAGVLFTYLPEASAAPLQLDYHCTNPEDGEFTSCRFRAAWSLFNLNKGYDGHTIALVCEDNFTVTYEIAHASRTVTPVLCGYNLAVGPNLRRKVALGYA
tara:strand:+ start:71 stop:565 length:495 start_codon:yes stop_codon:yes gene_type:complete